MKFLLALALFCTSGATAQVMLRNDFVLGKHYKLKNKGLSFIMINLDRHQNLNMLVNGRGGKSIVIDVQSIRKIRPSYTYSEIAERIYTPGPVLRPAQEAVPMFLRLPPPHLRLSEYGIRGNIQ